MLYIVLGGGALLVAVLDRLSNFQETSTEVVKESESLITRALIPLGSLVISGLFLYSVMREKK